ncbi:hypothetical protein M0802_012535 [Mischocyttarus mexicanus]|nr:hypothetical protein M0802_012535 [Mischocyttarus mexicanus]
MMQGKCQTNATTDASAIIIDSNKKESFKAFVENVGKRGKDSNTPSSPYYHPRTPSNLPKLYQRFGLEWKAPFALGSRVKSHGDNANGGFEYFSRDKRTIFSPKPKKQGKELSLGMVVCGSGDDSYGGDGSYGSYGGYGGYGGYGCIRYFVDVTCKRSKM